MGQAAVWYLALAVIGAGAVLPASLLFGSLRSGGVLYAKPLGLLLVAEIAWTVSAETPAPYGLPLVLASASVLWVWTGALVWRRPGLVGALRPRLTLLVAGEALCLALFALAVVVRMQAPNATDTEKPMDLMLLSAIRRATSMPPEDAWFSGMTVSYYHLGHVMVDVVGRLSGVVPATEMILGVASAGAMAGVAVFALAGDVAALSPLRQRASAWVAGTVAMVSLLFLATAEGFAELLSAHGVGPPGMWALLGVDGLPGTQFVSTGVPTEFWWWWRATRALPGTITEFPAFSIILGDLHAHLLALPLGAVALAAALPASAGRGPLTPGAWRRNPGALLLVAAMYAGLAMANSWDAVIYGALWGAAVLAVVMGAGWPVVGGAMVTVRYLTWPVIAALVIAGPFLASLQSVPVAFGLFQGPASDPVRFLLVWLPLIAPLAAAVVLLRPRAGREDATVAAGAACAVILGWAVANMLGGEGAALTARGAGWGTLALLVAAFAVAAGACATALRERDTARAAVFGLAAVASALVLGTELFYLRDSLGDRMNTVFKFWFAVWLILAVTGGAAAGLAFDRLRLPATLRARSLTAAGLAVCLVLYGGSLLYAPAAAVARAREGQTPGLDGLAYLERSDPGAAAAAAWAGEHLGPGSVLLEAVGRDYGQGNVVSAASGVPTLLGWRGHELTWRGNIPELGSRFFGVSAIYSDGAAPETQARAKELGVTHVYIGREERAQYGNDLDRKFAAWPTVFEAQGSRIVRVPDTGTER